MATNNSEVIRHFTKRFVLVVFLFFIVTSALGFLANSVNESATTCTTPVPVLFCGTVGPALTGDAIEGKQLFNANCAACHKLYKKATGPALANIDSITFHNWLTLPGAEITRKSESSELGLAGIEYHQNSWGQTLEESDIEALIAYCLSR